jgi:hypothetical protein
MPIEPLAKPASFEIGSSISDFCSIGRILIAGLDLHFYNKSCLGAVLGRLAGQMSS